MPISENIITEFKEFECLKESWELLRDRDLSAGMCMSWYWAKYWFKNYLLPEDRLFIHCYYFDNLLVGIFPVYLKKIPAGFQLCFICTGEAEKIEVGSEFQDFMLLDGYSEQLLKVFGESIRKNNDIVVIALKNVLESSHAYKWLAGKNLSLWHNEYVYVGERFSIPILQDVNQQVAAIPNKSNRRKARLYEKNNDCECKIVTNEYQFNLYFKELVALHNQYWQCRNVNGAFSQHTFTNFHYSYAKSMLEKGKLVIFKVTHQEKNIAIFYGVIDGDTLYFYQSGISVEEVPYAGVAMHYEAMNIARIKKIKTYDLMKGAKDGYKKRLTKNTRRVVNLTSYRKGYTYFYLSFLLMKKLKLIRELLSK